jgi:HlyD family type I secretion membrane fusion protein
MSKPDPKTQTPSRGAPQDARTRSLIRNGTIAAGAFFGGLLLWSVVAPIENAVVATATIEVESNRKDLQHLEGGIVSAIHVRENDRVAQGDLVLEFDETPSKTRLAVVEAQLADQMARAARLAAERRDAEAMKSVLPPENASDDYRTRLRDAWAAQADAFAARRQTRLTRAEVLESRKAQLDKRIAGLEAQAASVRRQIDLLGQELDGAKTLAKKGLTPKTRILALERGVEGLNSALGQHIADIAQTEEALGAATLEKVQVETEFREGIAREYAETQTSIAKLQEERVAAYDALRRTKIRAPRDGRVLNLSVHTLGGVVRPGEPVMTIVPEDDPLILTARVAPGDIEKIYPGADARIRFSSLSGSKSPEVTTQVLSVSADGMNDPQTGEVYFRAVLDLPEDRLGKLVETPLSPGMPAEAYIKTGRQSALAYFVKPLTDAFARTFRED